MSKTLTFLSDLDREFRTRVKLVLKDEARDQFEQQMDHIVQMFHKHDGDKSLKCYNARAQLKDGQLESTGTACLMLKQFEVFREIIIMVFGGIILSRY